MKHYIARLTFTDANMPQIKQKCESEQLAIAQINHWSKQFAGIKMLDFFTPENEKVCFYPNGAYFMTVPAETVKALNLKP